eukprot:919910-Pleurochrysis_carterae.AAC.4
MPARRYKCASLHSAHWLCNAKAKIVEMGAIGAQQSTPTAEAVSNSRYTEPCHLFSTWNILSKNHPYSGSAAKMCTPQSFCPAAPETPVRVCAAGHAEKFGRQLLPIDVMRSAMEDKLATDQVYTCVRGRGGRVCAEQPQTRRRDDERSLRYCARDKHRTRSTRRHTSAE